MANIRVDLNGTIKDGSAIMFRSPADCSAITGLIVYYVAEDGAAAYKEFVLADAHGHNVGDIDHLFAENVVVKVILDVTAGMAYVQNADTNAYIERTFIKSINGVAPDENGNVAVLGDSGSISVTDIPGGHRITIGGADGVTSFDVMNGQKGDSFTFEDLTEEQLAEFRSGTVLYTAQALGDAQKEQARANIGAAPASHATDKENPHGVTAEQVGAAPASHAEDKKNPHGVTAEQVGARPDNWMPTAEQVGARPADWMPTAEQVGARPDNWTPSPDEIGAVNGASPSLANMSVKEWARSLKTSAYAYTGPSTEDMPVEVASGSSYAIVSAKVVAGGTWVELRVNYVLTGCVAVCIYNGGWGEWEWENPPMHTGVEYRTTEEYSGYPVYVKVVSMGTLPNSTVKTVAFTDEDNARGIRVNGVAFNSTAKITIPVGSAGKFECGVYVSGKNIAVDCSADYSVYQSYCTVWYAKEGA